MSEEEKKAIKYLKKYIHWETFGERSLEADIETTLKLIEKQQKEIEELRSKNNNCKYKINKLKEKIKDIFSHHCPECGGVMQVEMLDSQIDKLVYKCKKCGKEWF